MEHCSSHQLKVIVRWFLMTNLKLSSDGKCLFQKVPKVKAGFLHPVQSSDPECWSIAMAKKKGGKETQNPSSTFFQFLFGFHTAQMQTTRLVPGCLSTANDWAHSTETGLLPLDFRAAEKEQQRCITKRIIPRHSMQEFTTFAGKLATFHHLHLCTNQTACTSARVDASWLCKLHAFDY